jgi:hypothetical protein
MDFEGELWGLMVGLCGVLVNGSAFSIGKNSAARKRGSESEIRDLWGHEKGNCSFLT